LASAATPAHKADPTLLMVEWVIRWSLDWRQPAMLGGLCNTQCLIAGHARFIGFSVVPPDNS